ncbi:unnamed protein product [Anisakis simplex]|uniref:Exostosin domain-containing protein n=1 Tax=Anisakis simplex TaxID=6269 RepID=A0A0M3K862_ANISI|nr:unnamed protein product [Anisakis simplex]
MLWNNFSAERLSSVTPCAYPLVSDAIHCGIDDPLLRQSVRVCDPDKVISMSEVEVIKDKLEDIYSHKTDFCICRHDQPRPCWYRFGFAFLRHMLAVDSGVSHLYSREFCPANETLLRYTKSHDSLLQSKESVQHYGDHFARLIRERWLMGECDEDVLFLILLRRPDQLISRNLMAHSFGIPLIPAPYIFASYGPLVVEKVDALDPKEEDFPLKYRVDSLTRIVEAENENLENGYPLKAVVERLLERFEQTLSKAEEAYSAPRVRHHIPDWAIAVFAACAFLCILMAFGLCLMRTSVRRGSQRGKPADTARRWKAGFVGENMEGVPTGGVNLMQMMLMPSSSRNVTTATVNN